MWTPTVLLQPLSQAVVTLFLVLIVLLLLLLMFRFNRKTKLNLPPSPPNKIPILGHLFQLGTHPHVNLHRLARKHGPIMLLHLGYSPTVVISSAELAQEIFKTHDHIFSSRPPMSVAKTIFYGKDLAFAPYGKYWKQMRRICALQLLNTKRIQSFRSIREEEIEVMIDKISRSSYSSSSTLSSSSIDNPIINQVVINLREILTSFMTDIICRIAYGKKYWGEEIIGRNFGEMIADVIHLMGIFNVGEFIPWLAWVNNFNGLNRMVKKTFKELDIFFEGVVEEHIQYRNKKKTSKDGNDEEDNLVDVLLTIQENNNVSLGRDNIKAIILDIFIGGTDTSHTTIEWAMAELLRNPKIIKKVQEEVRGIARGKPNITEDDLYEMHYLKAVIKETLRLHLPAPLLLPRESNEFIKLQGYDIPAKTRVITNAWAIARDPISWEEPQKFEPKRFMNSSTDYKGNHFELIPFGSGRRGCPGIQFGTAIIELALANLLYRFDWGLPNGMREDELDMSESEFGVVTHKKSPLILVATEHFILKT